MDEDGTSGGSAEGYEDPADYAPEEASEGGDDWTPSGCWYDGDDEEAEAATEPYVPDTWTGPNAGEYTPQQQAADRAYAHEKECQDWFMNTPYAGQVPQGNWCPDPIIPEANREGMREPIEELPHQAH